MQTAVQKTVAFAGALALIASPVLVLATSGNAHTPVAICQRTDSTAHPYHKTVIDDNALPAHLAKGSLYPVPGSGCPDSLTPAVPTVALLIDPELFFAESPYLAPLSWGSTNANACEGSAEQIFPVQDPPWTTEFIGPQATSGLLLVNFEGSGTYMFTLTCTGPGGTASTSTVVEAFTSG